VNTLSETKKRAPLNTWQEGPANY